MADDNRTPVALVIGAGDATGGAIAKRFARGGFIACMTRRDAAKLEPLVEAIRASGGSAHGFGSDARKEEEVVALVERIEREHRADRRARLQHRRQRARRASSTRRRASTSRSGRWPASAAS